MFYGFNPRVIEIKFYFTNNVVDYDCTDYFKDSIFKD